MEQTKSHCNKLRAVMRLVNGEHFTSQGREKINERH